MLLRLLSRLSCRDKLKRVERRRRSIVDAEVVVEDGIRAIVLVFLCTIVDAFVLDMRSEAVLFCRRRESKGAVVDEESPS